MKSRRCLAFLVASLPFAAHAAEPLRLDASPAFMSSEIDTSVLRVTIENDGQATQGVLLVQNEAGPVSYPVDLPHGSRKSVLVASDSTDEVRLTLRTDQGTVTQKLYASIPSGTTKRTAIAYVGDNRGSLSFLVGKRDGVHRDEFRDAYTLPAAAPDRAFAYRRFDAVMLGPGSEKLDDRAVAALQTYAMSGGTVVVFGGDEAQVLQDGRWAEALPGRDWRPHRQSTNMGHLSDGRALLSPEHSVLEPEVLTQGAHELNEVFSRGYGLGRVVVLGYSPNDPALKGWPQLPKTVALSIQADRNAQARELLGDYQSGQSGQDATSGVARRASTLLPMPGGGAMNGAGAGSDPFQTRLPSSTSVFGLLALYFVLVVPGSYFVLRRMKRAEWAWATAPLLAFGFAGLLFRSAQGLYAAKLSTATTGLVVMQEGAPDALFFGRSQFFIPDGGVYDLGLENADAIDGTWDEAAPGYEQRVNSQGLQGFNLVDDGAIRAPRLEASSLSFHEMSYRQRLQAGAGFRSRRLDATHVLIENGTPWTFQGRLVNGRCYGPQIVLAPGEKRNVALGEGLSAVADPTVARDPANYTAASGRIALSGSLTGLRPGPQLGEPFADRSHVAVLAFLKESVQ